MNKLLKDIEKYGVEQLVRSENIGEVDVDITFRGMRTPGFCTCCGDYNRLEVPAQLTLSSSKGYSLQLDVVFFSNSVFGDRTDIATIRKDIAEAKVLAYADSNVAHKAAYGFELYITVSTKEDELQKAISSVSEVEAESCSQGVNEFYVVGAFAENIQDALISMFSPSSFNRLRPELQDMVSTIKKGVLAEAEEQLLREETQIKDRIKFRQHRYEQFDILPPPNLTVMVGESLRPITT